MHRALGLTALQADANVSSQISIYEFGHSHSVRKLFRFKITWLKLSPLIHGQVEDEREKLKGISNNKISHHGFDSFSRNERACQFASACKKREFQLGSEEGDGRMLSRNAHCSLGQNQELGSEYRSVRPRILFVNGIAGTGKTTIAFSVADWAYSKGILTANFFFAGDEKDLNDYSLVFSSLAHQIAQFNLDSKHEVAKALEQDPDVARQILVNQFDRLILRPLKAAEPSIPNTTTTTLFILDALDECADKKKICEILRILLS